MTAKLTAWASAHPVWAAICAAVAFFIVTGIANWATYPDDVTEWERIKRDEPRRAGLLLILRGWGFYPAKIWRGLVAVVTGRLTGTSVPPKPPTLPPLPLLLMGLAVAALSMGCAVSFEEARGLSSVHVYSAPALDRSACIKLDNSRQLHDALSKGAFAIALGTAGFPGAVQAVRDEGASKELVIGTVIGAVVVAGVGTVFHVVAEGRASTYMRECSS